jgi:HAMP domain-containing protein
VSLGKVILGLVRKLEGWSCGCFFSLSLKWFLSGVWHFGFLWRKMRQKESLMSSSSSSFSSVKLSSGLVSQARDAATPMRRSVAGQIEYWATLGRIAEASGLTISEAREAIALYDVRQTTTVSAADPLDAIEADFVAAESTGRLAQAVRQTVQSNRRQVVKAA